MYNIILKAVENKYDYNELIKIFLNPDSFHAYTEAEINELTETEKEDIFAGSVLIINEKETKDKNEIKREI